MIEYSVYTQEEIQRITAANMIDDTDTEWADAFQDFLNEFARDGWIITTVHWSETSRVPESIIVEKHKR